MNLSGRVGVFMNLSGRVGVFKTTVYIPQITQM